MSEQQTVAEQLAEKDKKIRELQEVLEKSKDKSSEGVEELRERIADLHKIVEQLRERLEAEEQHVEDLQEVQNDRSFWEPF